MAVGDVYFNYGSRIESKRLAEAIAMPFGTGPICGFGSADIDGDKLKVYPWAVGDKLGGAGSDNFTDPAKYLMRDLIRNHYIPRAEDADISSYRITFGCIAKDGILYRSGESSINNITIEGGKGTFNQVLLFAEHKHVTEPVNNLVSFRAFWNTSSFDFYSLYKESLDIYYPSTRSARKASISDKNDPILKEKFSYDYLINKVEGACRTYQDNQKTMVLIGIYGTGINNDPENGGNVEKFAIVPYGGQFPAPIRYNTSIHSYFKEALKRMEAFLDYTRIEGATDPDTGQSLTFTSLPEYVEWLINQKTISLQKSIEAVALPTGSIILFDGEEIPDGWEVYDKAAGRVVIGYQAGGILLSVTGDSDQTILQSVGDTYNPSAVSGTWSIPLNKNNLPRHRHSTGYTRIEYKSSVDPNGDNPTIIDFDYRDKTLTERHGVTNKLTSGAALTSWNLVGDRVTDEQTANLNTTYLNKMVPAITLRYIKKISNKG